MKNKLDDSKSVYKNITILMIQLTQLKKIIVGIK